MTIRQVLAAIDSPAAARTAIQAAACIAARKGADLVLLCVIPPAAGPRYAGGLTLRKVMDETAERAHARAAECRSLLEEIARRHDLRAECRIVEGLPSQEAVLHARYSDLAVIARAEPDPAPSSFPLWPDEVVLTAGRPVVVVPREGEIASVGRRIVIAWNASQEATRAVNDAMPLLTAAEAVEIVLVDPGKAHEGFHGHGEEPGADIAAHLARHGVSTEVRVEHTTGESVGERITARAAALGADLIVSGAFGYSRWRELVLGGVTRHLIENARVPVFLSR